MRRGIAVWNHGGIEYIASQWLAGLDAHEAGRRADDRMVEERGGVLWWNGCDHSPTACHIPGENVILPRPDRAGGYLQQMQGVK